MKSLLCASLLLCAPLLCATTPEVIAAAREVIARFAGEEVARSLRMESLPEAEGGRHAYEVEDNGRTLRGSSAVALCKAFYANARAKGAGICSWTGNRFDAAAAFAPSKPVRVEAPFRHYQYFNVCTFGYTMPYWDEARWMREIDWMALHGIDMPLALLANEAIAERVWRRMGLTEEEIESSFVGPAHLPWMRMGNISGRPDALPKAWRERSVRLQHAVLKRMRALGMKPIVPGFAGFVPEGLRRVRPEARLLKMHWSGFHAWFLSPDQPLFREMGRMYVEEWEREFGPCEYWLADSFNEMELPWKTEPEILEGLALCGANVYGAIQDAHPGATWVLQGWMFGYQRHIWTSARFKALLGSLPNERLLILDMAENYNMTRWRNGANYEVFPGFFDKPWVWGTIPNMGGKSLPGEVLPWLANAHLEALASPNRGRLVGYGLAPEGIENCEVIYELLADVGWRATHTNLREWLRTYNRCRYGASPEALERFWDAWLAGAYAAQVDHPRFFWQFSPGASHGSFRGGEHTVKAAEAFAACAAALGHSPLYRCDLREFVAFAAGHRLETVLRAEAQAHEEGDASKAAHLRATATTLFQGIDATLKGHPTLDLRAWIAKARAAAEGNASLADAYETNARRIVTVWGPPVNDYAARVWSGLVGSYYLPRYLRFWDARDKGTPADLPTLERLWVENRPALAEPTGDPDPLHLLARVRALPANLDRPTQGRAIGQWAPGALGDDWRELAWDLPATDLRAAKRLRFRYTKGNHRLDIAKVVVEMDGVDVQTLTPNGYAGTPSRNNVLPLHIPADATGNNGCRIRATVRGNGGHDSHGTVELLP